MMENEKISIIVPVYKVEKYLRVCVDSILNQTYRDLEIILVDDGSPDNCPKICDEYAEKDKRIKVVHQKNGGLSSARNTGIDIATGKYLMFVDSDDTIHPQMCEILFKNLLETDADMSECGWKKVWDINNPNNQKYEASKTQYVTYENNDVFDLLYNKKIPSIMTAWKKLYKKELFQDIRYPIGKIHEDEDVIHKILFKCKKHVFANYPMYNYTQRGDSITASFNAKRLVILDILRDRIDFIKEFKPEYEKKAIMQYVRVSILYYYYCKWSNMQSEANDLKKEIDVWVKKGYSSFLTFMFKTCPYLLGCMLKLKYGR